MSFIHSARLYILVYVFTFIVSFKEFIVCTTVGLMELLILKLIKSLKCLKFSSTALAKPIFKE